MTTTTIEQFREQCAKIADDCFTDDEGSHAYKRIMALPLPVMPEQAEPVAYQYRIATLNGVDIGDKWTQCEKKAFDAYVEFAKQESITYESRKLYDQDPSALLARIAELEAENGHLRSALKAHGDLEISEEDEDA